MDYNNGWSDGYDLYLNNGYAYAPANKTPEYKEGWQDGYAQAEEDVPCFE